MNLSLFGRAVVIAIIVFCLKVNNLFGEGLEIINYSPADYKGYNQNWSVACAPNGLVYVGNNAGLLEYDGSVWNLFAEKNNNIVRSVYVDFNSRVYTGSFEDFGYWEADKFGNLVYNSLVDDNIRQSLHNDQIWKITQVDDAIYFQSFDKIFRADSDGTVHIIRPPRSALFMAKANDKLLVYGSSDGIYELEGVSFSKLDGSEALAEFKIHSVLPYDNNSIIVGTSNDGLFKQKGNTFEYWDCDCSDLLSGNELNRGMRARNGKFIFGTINGGVVICSGKGDVLNVINKDNGLQNNTVLGMELDPSGNSLWLALNQGVDKINLNSPYTNFSRGQNFGSVFTGALHNDVLYLGTNQGVYAKKVGILTNETVFNGDFELVPGTIGQVWNISEIDGQLILGHSSGTFVLADNELKSISRNDGGWNMIPFSYRGEELLLQNTYNQLLIYEKDPASTWKLRTSFEGLNEPLQYIEIDGNMNIWGSHEEKGVYKIRLTEDLNRIKQVNFYGAENGFGSDYNINVFKIHDEIVFTSLGRLYYYDALNDSIMDYSLLNDHVLKKEHVRRVSKVSDSNYWLVSKNSFLELKIDDEGLSIKNEHPFERFGDFVPEKYENVVGLNDSLVMLCYPTGFTIYNTNQSINRNQLSQRPHLRKVVYNQKPLPISSKNSKIQLAHGNGGIVFQVAAPVHYMPVSGFKYFLKGWSDKWSEVQNSPEIHIPQLSMGNYELKVKFVNDLGESSQAISYAFSVKSPWYLAWYALIGYILFFIMVYFIVRHFVRKNIARKQAKLRADLELERQRQQEEDRQRHEKEIVMLKNEKLMGDVNSKAKQLASSTMATVRKNEVLLQIKNDLTKFDQLKEAAERKKHYSSILNTIDANLKDEEDWSMFEENFDQTHQNFTKKIRANYPELTPKEIRFCTYLRMNLSSKEIATLLNITVGGIEVKRYRLRKKLQLSHDQNLVDFLMTID